MAVLSKNVGVSIPASPPIGHSTARVMCISLDKRILLIDLNDARRDTRVMMLTAAGYQVDVRLDEVEAEGSGEPTFDLVVLSLHTKHLAEAAAYSERLRKKNPTLPILLLLDAGVLVPHGTLSQWLETGVPMELMERVAEMLAGSTHIRELMSAAQSSDIASHAA